MNDNMIDNYMLYANIWYEHRNRIDAVFDED